VTLISHRSVGAFSVVPFVSPQSCVRACVRACVVAARPQRHFSLFAYLAFDGVALRQRCRRHVVAAQHALARLASHLQAAARTLPWRCCGAGQPVGWCIAIRLGRRTAWRGWIDGVSRCVTVVCRDPRTVNAPRPPADCLPARVTLGEVLRALPHNTRTGSSTVPGVSSQSTSYHFFWTLLWSRRQQTGKAPTRGRTDQCVAGVTSDGKLNKKNCN